MDVGYNEIGDTVDDSCTIITAVHTSCSSSVIPIKLKTPPCMPARPFGTFIWEPFNRPEHALCLGQDDNKFNKEGQKMIATIPRPADASASPSIKIMYYLHQDNHDYSIFDGTSVLSPGSLYPPFESCLNHNLFQNYFGIEFHHDGSTYVHAISTYEFTQCFGLIKQIQYWLSHEQHRFSLDASMPGRTLAWLVEKVQSHFVCIHDDNREVFSPNQFAAPASTIQTLVNGTIYCVFLLMIIG
jgi:hypothetical protein